MNDREALVAALDPAIRDYGWLQIVEDAARERLAQLPDEQGGYLAKTLERIATAVFDFDRTDPSGTRGRYERMAAAILTALDGETP